MKHKKDQAQALLDALEQVDEGMLQQAYTTDSPEKFRTLGATTVGKIKKERPVTALRRWVAVAACLAVTLILAASPWVFSSLLSASTHTTQPTQPTNTITTEPTVPSTPTLPNTQIRLERVMEIWYHNDSTHLLCTYIVDSDHFYTGETITVTVTVENAGGMIKYTGALEDQFGAAQLRSDSDSSYAITSAERPTTDDVTEGELAHLAEASIVYQFTVPENAPEDHYTLEATIFGNPIVFDFRATLRPRYIPCLADLSEEAQKMIVGEAYNSEGYKKRAKSAPIYGEFADLYVTYLHSGGDAVVTYETVNGLTFVYGTSAHIEVYTPTGICSLTNAFDSGLLNAEQIQQIYDNWKAIGLYIDEGEYDHYIQLRSNIRLNHWGENRWACIYIPHNGYRHVAGDTIQIKVSIINNGPETTYDHIKNEIEATAWLVSDRTGVTLESSRFDGPYSGVNDGIWATGENTDVFFTFVVPEDFYEGTYTFVISVDGEEMRFDEKAVEEARKITVLNSVDSWCLRLMFGENYRNDPVFQQNKHMPVYGEYVGKLNEKWYGVYAYIYPTGSTKGHPTIEIVNGLEFEVPDGYQFYVYSYEYGTFTLSEAFEIGIITEGMLQEIYANHIFLQNSSSSIVP